MSMKLISFTDLWRFWRLFVQIVHFVTNRLSPKSIAMKCHRRQSRNEISSFDWHNCWRFSSLPFKIDLGRLGCESFKIYVIYDRKYVRDSICIIFMSLDLDLACNDPLIMNDVYQLCWGLLHFQIRQNMGRTRSDNDPTLISFQFGLS